MMEVFRFKNLGRWDKFTIPHLHFPTHVPSEQIGRLLKPRDERVDRTKWRFEELQPITIHFGGDISRRKVAAGREYTLPLLWVRPGDVVLSKIDLKNGAVGVLEDGWDNAVVTTHFKVYEPDLTRIEPAYFRMLLQTGEFKRWLWANRSGADGRTEVKLDVFEELEIPLPPLSEQQAIVAAWRAALDHAAALEREAAETEAKAAAAFETALGFAPPTPLPDRPVFVANFKNLDRWGHEPALRRTLAGPPPTSSYAPRQLGDLVDDIVVGWSPKCLERAKDDQEWGVLKLSAVTSGRFKAEENKALRLGVKPKPELEVKKGDVLITRGSGVTRLVGAAVFVEDEPPPHLMICDLIFRVAFSEDGEIDPAFLAFLLATSELRSQIEDQRTGAAPMMQKTTKTVLMGLTFPLPPLPEQQKMVQSLTDARSKGAQQRIEAAAARANAWADFEASVYSAEVVEETAAQIPAAS